MYHQRMYHRALDYSSISIPSLVHDDGGTTTVSLASNDDGTFTGNFPPTPTTHHIYTFTMGDTGDGTREPRFPKASETDGKATKALTQHCTWRTIFLWLAGSATHFASRVWRCTRHAIMRVLDALLLFLSWRRSPFLALSEEEYIDWLIEDISDDDLESWLLEGSDGTIPSR